MTTIVLNSQTSGLSIDHLLRQAEGGGVQVKDAQGNVLACVVSPASEALVAYIEAVLDLKQNQDKVRQALARRGGITTAELLKRAEAAAKQAGNL